MHTTQRTAFTVLAAFTFVALATDASSAQGAIIGVSGQTTWLGVAPVACTPGALTGPNAFTWNEQQGIFVNNVQCDMINNPGVSPGVPGLVSGLVDNHFIHFEPNTAVQFVSGSVTFASRIRGVIFRNVFLDITDIPLGAPGTLYPTGYPLRGLNAASMFSINNNVLTFQFAAPLPTADILQLRVITEHFVPSPGSMALLGLGGLVAVRRRR
jgi:uncharacterized protein (TIGR03382 family)